MHYMGKQDVATRLKCAFSLIVLMLRWCFEQIVEKVKLIVTFESTNNKTDPFKTSSTNYKLFPFQSITPYNKAMDFFIVSPFRSCDVICVWTKWEIKLNFQSKEKILHTIFKSVGLKVHTKQNRMNKFQGL
jgi:hypothetical protein